MRTVLLLAITLAKMSLPFNGKSCNVSEIECDHVTYFEVQHGANNPKQPLDSSHHYHEGDQLWFQGSDHFLALLWSLIQADCYTDTP